MKTTIFAFFMFCAVIIPCRAEGEINPNLGFVFPLEKRGDKVFLKSAVFLNPDCVVPAGSHLRVMYLLPRVGDDDVKKKRRKEKYNPALARQPHDAKSSETDTLTPDQRDIYDRAMTTVWKEDISFRAALERWDLLRARLVFQRPGKEDIEVENFDFPEGMLLSEIDGKIIVLHIEKDSLADKNGIKPQTVILSLDGRSFDGKLESFRKIYLEEKAKKQSGDRLLIFSALAPSAAESKDIILKLPLSLDSDIWSAK